jgi:hypothetical protein
MTPSPLRPRSWMLGPDSADLNHADGSVGSIRTLSLLPTSVLGVRTMTLPSHGMADGITAALSPCCWYSASSESALDRRIEVPAEVALTRWSAKRQSTRAFHPGSNLFAAGGDLPCGWIINFRYNQSTSQHVQVDVEPLAGHLADESLRRTLCTSARPVLGTARRSASRRACPRDDAGHDVQAASPTEQGAASQVPRVRPRGARQRDRAQMGWLVRSGPRARWPSRPAPSQVPLHHGAGSTLVRALAR